MEGDDPFGYTQPVNEKAYRMLEAKAKDEAVFRLIRQLKYKTNYKFIDDTSFLV